MFSGHHRLSPEKEGANGEGAAREGDTRTVLEKGSTSCERPGASVEPWDEYVWGVLRAE